MARIRTIKPEFFTSAQVMECSPIARLMFIGLWNFCDDGGRMPCSVKRIKAQIFPSDDIDSSNVRRMLDELSSNGLVEFYTIDAIEYLQVTGWARHQRIDKPSYQHPDRTGKIPEWGTHIRRTFDDRSTQESNGVEGSRRESKGVESKGVESKKKEGASPPRTRARETAEAMKKSQGQEANPASWPDGYREEFDAEYPHKVGMAIALEILDGIKVSGKVKWQELMAGLEGYKNKTDSRQWANPKTWLTEERWNDRPGREPAEKANGHRRGADHDAEVAAIAARIVARETEAPSGGSAVSIGGRELGGDNAAVIPGNG